MTGMGSFVVVLAVYMAAAVLVLTVGLLGVIVAIRVLANRRQVWRQALIERWRPVLTEAVVEIPSSAPPLSNREAAEIIPMWAYYHEFLDGDCRQGLNKLARLCDIDIHAKKALRSDNVRERLFAIQVLGNLRDRETRRLLRPIAYTGNPYLSLAAAHALLRIEPREAIEEIVPMIASRPDWSPARVISMLREAGPDVISEPLAKAAIDADIAYQPLLIIYLDTADEQVAFRAIRAILLATADQQVTITCLYQLGRMAHPDGIKLVRTYLEHPNWLIQLHAVAGIGRMGSDRDIDDLVRMLSHKQYWVRYRAAQALANLPTMSRDRLEGISESQTDRYAKDILTQVISGEMAA